MRYFVTIRQPTESGLLGSITIFGDHFEALSLKQARAKACEAYEASRRVVFDDPRLDALTAGMPPLEGLEVVARASRQRNER